MPTHFSAASGFGTTNKSRGHSNMATTTTEPVTKRRLTEQTAWKDLKDHCQKMRPVHLRDLFANDGGRGLRFAAEATGIYLDYSKNRVTGETMQLLLQLAEESDLRGRIDAMFAGEKINRTEDRAVLHVALRTPRTKSIFVDGKDVVPGVHEVLHRMTDFAARIRG